MVLETFFMFYMILYGFYMDFIWILCGFYVVFVPLKPLELTLTLGGELYGAAPPDALDVTPGEESTEEAERTGRSDAFNGTEATGAKMKSATEAMEPWQQEERGCLVFVGFFVQLKNFNCHISGCWKNWMDDVYWWLTDVLTAFLLGKIGVEMAA